MGLRQWIQENREQIDKVILTRCPLSKINDEDRRQWVLNDETLYLWARSDGVKI